MSRILKRVLTRKSILGFGYASVRDLSVQMILDLGKRTYLVSSYYGLEKITFTDDILDELGIKEEFRIEKPGKMKNYDEVNGMVYKINNEYYKDASELDKIKITSHRNKVLKNGTSRRNSSRKETKGKRANRNQGHGGFKY